MFHKTIIVAALVGALSCLAQQAIAQDSHVPVHGGGWPIQNGVKHQPTRGRGGRGILARARRRRPINCTMS